MRIAREPKKSIGIALAVLLAGFGAYLLIPEMRHWVAAAANMLVRGDINAVRAYLLSFGPLAPVVSALLMVFQSVVAPLPAFVITFTNGLLFGAWWGALLSWSSAMAGAAICFWIARALGRPVVEKIVGGSRALEVSDRFFDRYGDRAVLITRLLPFVSFDIVSYGAGLTPISFWRFFAATGIGQLPATLVYSYLGQNLTGSVRVVFWTFIATVVLVVTLSSLKPVYESRFLRDGKSKPAAVQPGLSE